MSIWIQRTIICNQIVNPMPNSKIFLHKSKKFGVPAQFDGMEARLHACSARMQSIPPEAACLLCSHAEHSATKRRNALCITRLPPRGGTGATRQATRPQAGMGVRCGGRVRPAAAPLFITHLLMNRSKFSTGSSFSDTYVVAQLCKTCTFTVNCKSALSHLPTSVFL